MTGPRSWARGWRLFRDYQAPLPTKVRMTVGNNLIKLRQRQVCCGHPGEPGC